MKQIISIMVAVMLLMGMTHGIYSDTSALAADLPTEFAGAGYSTVFDLNSGFQTPNTTDPGYTVENIFDVTAYNFDYPTGNDGTNSNWYYYGNRDVVYGTQMYGTIDFASYTINSWVALVVNVPKSGIYSMSLKYHYQSGANKIGVYFLPLGTTTTNISEIVGNQQPDGTLTYSSNNFSATPRWDSFGNVAIAEEGECLMVIKVTELGSGGNPARMSMTKIVLDGTDPNADATYGGTSTSKTINFTNSGVPSTATITNVTQYDPAKNADWYYYGKNSVSDVYNYYYPLRSSGCSPGSWVAFKVKSPGAGKYKLSIGYRLYLPDANRASVTILPGNTIESMIPLLADGAKQPVGVFNYKGAAGDWTNELGVVNLDDEEELYVILRFEELISSETVMDISKLTFDGTRPPPTEFAGAGNSTVFDLNSGFQTPNTTDPGYTVENIFDVTAYNFDYPTGRDGTNDNWYYYGNRDIVYGTQMYGTIDFASYTINSWVALVVNVPKSGIYSMSLKYHYQSGANKIGVYFLPLGTTTTNISEIVGNKQPDGTLTYTSNNFSATPRWDSFGNVPIAEEGECLMVIKVTELGSGGNPARMSMTKIVLDGADPNADATYGGASTSKTINFTNSGVASNATITNITQYDPAKNADWYYYGKNSVVDVYNYYYPLRSSGCSPGSWVAFKVKSPGAGKYKLSIGYRLYLPDANKASVIILPGSTPGSVIPSLADRLKQPVGMFNYKGAAGDWSNEVGVVNLDNEQELYVILRFEEKISAEAVMDITSLTFDGTIPNFVLSGSIAGTKGTKPVNVTIQNLTTQQVYSGTAQSNGTYSFQITVGNSPVDYRLTATAEGYTTYQKTIHVGGDLSQVSLQIYGGDISSDGVINIIDIASIISNFGQTAGAGNVICDINDDTAINAGDIAVIIENIGKRNKIE